MVLRSKTTSLRENLVLRSKTENQLCAAKRRILPVQPFFLFSNVVFVSKGIRHKVKVIRYQVKGIRHEYKNSGFVSLVFVSLVVGANASHAKGEPMRSQKAHTVSAAFALFLLRGVKKHKPVREKNSFKKEKQKINLVS